MSFAVKAEGLGKRYLIGHQRDRASYATLRESLAASGRALVNRVRHPFITTGGANIEEFWALKDVSFEIQPGDRVGIIGRNGAGKSTLLKILSRITEPTTGRFVTRGRVASLLEVGTGFHPELTGRENIYLNGAILGMSKADVRRQFDAIVDFSGVEKFLDTPVKRYSSGMYVRLAFAVAAHLEPDILIVDEVLAVGDAEFQKKCLGKMEDVGKEGRTVIFVSHNMGAIQVLCSEGVLINQASLIEKGPINQCIDTYTSLFNAQRSVEVIQDDGSFAFSNVVLNIRDTSKSKGHTIEVAFDFSCQKKLSDFELDVALESGDSILWHHQSKASGFKLEVAPNQVYRYTIQTEFPPLSPNTISLSLYIRKGSHIYYYAKEIASANIKAHSDAPQIINNKGLLAIHPAINLKEVEP